MAIAISIVTIAALALLGYFAAVVRSLSRNPVVPWEVAVSSFSDSPRVPVVVSLTTTPKRLQGETLGNVLASVMAQNPRPQAIEINIPYRMKRLGQDYEIPQWLIDSPVEIHRCEDLGPATKYASTLQRYDVTNRDQKILVIDDDLIMPVGLVGAANAAMDAHPDSAVCGHGMVLKAKGSPKVRFSLTNFVTGDRIVLRWVSQHKQRIRRPEDVQAVDVITGYQGYGIRPRFFDVATLVDYSGLPPEAFFVDDMVISARLAERGIPRLVSGVWRTFTLENSMKFGLFIAEYLRNFIKLDPRTDNLSSGVNQSDHNNNVVVRHFWRVW
ncbi:hypothetical protein [Hoeflea sp.]|uniref:hypothetical protein n=1 Tax=Hoeflea sp. TaxID=1940281 RepID=UPI003B52A4C9